MKKSDIVLLAFAALGILLALYAIPLHYKTGPSTLCNLSETFNCDKVNKSPWSELFGIPVAIFGLLSYLLVFFLLLKRNKIQEILAFTEKDFWQYFLLLIAVMFLFQVYLTIAEIFWIHAYCIVCVTSQLTVLVLLGGTLFRLRTLRDHRRTGLYAARGKQ